MAASALVRSSKELGRRQAFYRVSWWMELSRVGIGGSLSPDLEKAQGLIGFQNPEGSLEFSAYC